MKSQRGFSLVEVTIAAALSLFLMIIAGTMAVRSVEQQQMARGKIDVIDQNAQIKDLIFNTVNQNAGPTCVERMGLATIPFNRDPVQPTPLTPANFVGASQFSSRIESIYLIAAKEVRVVGNFIEYTAQLRVRHAVLRNVASADVIATKADSTLGLINLTVDGGGQIVSCSWNANDIDENQLCDGINGTEMPAATCFSEPTIQIKTDCPNQYALIAGHCIARNVTCYQQSLGDNFDGSKFACEALPTTMAIRYPPGFTAPLPPTTGGQPTGTAPASGTQLPPPPSPPCPCGNGNQSIPAGDTTTFCIQARSIEGGLFQNTDTVWEVRQCNSAGALVPRDKHGWVIDTDSPGFDYPWRRGTCTLTGKTKQKYGRVHSKGTCQ